MAPRIRRRTVWTLDRGLESADCGHWTRSTFTGTPPSPAALRQRYRYRYQTMALITATEAPERE
eukprot:scaffold1105_cov140-Isochrysis_galbana.AAC.7